MPFRVVVGRAEAKMINIFLILILMACPPRDEQCLFVNWVDKLGTKPRLSCYLVQTWDVLEDFLSCAMQDPSKNLQHGDAS